METINSIISQISEVASRLRVGGLTVEWYLFGSILKDTSNYKDIDLLIVYDASIIPAIVKGEMHLLELLYPIHFTFLNQKEESEFNFINEQHAVKIFPLS